MMAASHPRSWAPRLYPAPPLPARPGRRPRLGSTPPAVGAVPPRPRMRRGLNVCFLGACFVNTAIWCLLIWLVVGH